MNEENLLKHKMMDAAKRAFQHNIYTYTNFLSISELSVLNSMKHELSFIHYETFGGNAACERQVVQFGSESELGYHEDYPIDLIQILPLSPKFAEKLEHRDYLGALMNLGIARELLGDIIIKEKETYLYCLNHISDFIVDSLDTIKHTHVQCCKCSENIDGLLPHLTDIEIIAASPRIDAVVASITRTSRNQVIELFRSGKIFVNGTVMNNYSYKLKPEDILVIRKTGKFIYQSCGNETRKGRVYIKLQKYE